MSPPNASFDLRLLQQFLSVADLLSFRKAAEKMHMAQPPLSQAIMRLEGMLETQLFERSPRGVTLTVAGEVFKTQARRLLNQADRAVELTREAGHGQFGNVHIGFIGPAMYAFLPRVILAFRRQFPGVKLHLHEASSVEVAQLLDSRAVDIGFLVAPARLGSDVVVQEVFLDELHVVLPVGHRLGKQARIRIEDLIDDPFVLFSAKGVPLLRERIMSLCRGAGFEPDIVQEAVQIPTVLGLVAGGLGVSILPGSAQALFPAEVICKPIEADQKLLRVDIAVAYRQESLGDAAQAFLEIARQWTGDAFSGREPRASIMEPDRPIGDIQ